MLRRARVRRGSADLALAALAGVVALQTASWARPPAPAPTSWPAVSPDSESGHEDLLRQTDAIVDQVAALRGLRPLHPVARGVLDRATITAKIAAKMRAESPPGEIDAEGRVYKRLGLLPRSTDYEKLLVALLGEQVGGFYDPESKALYVADWLPMTVQRPALAHEIGHALVDQHFDLARFDRPLRGESDRQMAQSALIEGDGTLVMMEYIAAPLGIDLSKAPLDFDDLGKLAAAGSAAQPIFDSAPVFLQEELLFPYLAGLKFVLALRARGSWADVDAAYADPPVSTAQILHPEKYLAGEQPVPVTAPAGGLMAGAEPLDRDVLGELGFRVFLEAHMTPAVAHAASAGWAGDRLVADTVPPPRGAPAGAVPRDELADLSVWETGEDACEAFDALAAALGQMARIPVPAPASATTAAGAVGACKDREVRVYAGKGGDAFAVERRGVEVVFTVGAASASEAAFRGAAWRQLVVGAAGRAVPVVHAAAATPTAGNARESAPPPPRPARPARAPARRRGGRSRGGARRGRARPRRGRARGRTARADRSTRAGDRSGARRPRRASRAHGSS